MVVSISEESVKAILGPVVNVITFFWVMGLGPIIWILRDGLGPDAVESHGMEALRRFLLTFYWGPIGLFLIVWAIREWQSRQNRHAPC